MTLLKSSDYVTFENTLNVVISIIIQAKGTLIFE